MSAFNLRSFLFLLAFCYHKMSVDYDDNDKDDEGRLWPAFRNYCRSMTSLRMISNAIRKFLTAATMKSSFVDVNIVVSEERIASVIIIMISFSLLFDIGSKFVRWVSGADFFSSSVLCYAVYILHLKLIAV
jgi:hypothetical protein